MSEGLLPRLHPGTLTFEQPSPILRLKSFSSEGRAPLPYERTVEHLGFKCLGPTITPERILRLREEVFHNEELHALRQILHALSGPMRLKILYLLYREPELCVCDLADILDESVSAVSHQLRVLRRHDLVQTRRDAKTIFYALNEPLVNRYINFEREVIFS